MAELFEQKYPNTIRTISGLVNTPYQDDCVLECDTSLGAVTLDLLGIPANKWSTQYKLYVVDKSNNAGTNNITINAPVGFKINGASSVVINSNGASFVIRVAGNTNYVGQYSLSGVGVTGYTTIEDEGVPLPQRNTMNFVGGGVNVTDAGGKTIVTISGGIVSLTNAQLLALVTAGTIVAGQFYLVTDAPLVDEGVIVQGVKNNGYTTIQGSAIYLNADYQKVGIYTGVAGFVGALGLWSTFVQPVAIGNVVVWNNLNYVSLTGVWNQPDTNPADWSPLAKSTTTGYIREIDSVKYNIVTNNIIYRADFRGNEVEGFKVGGDNTLVDFQWGRDDCYSNRVFGTSVWKCTNSNDIITYNYIQNSKITDETPTKTIGTITRNTILDGSNLLLLVTEGLVAGNLITTGSTLSITTSSGAGTRVRGNLIQEQSSMILGNVGNACVVEDNTILGISTFTINTCNGLFAQKNYLNNGGVFTVLNLLLGVTLRGCEVSDANTVNITTPIAVTTDNFKVRKGFSNWEATLDYADPLVFAGVTLTIPVALAYVGVFNALNSTATTTNRIVNAPTNHEFILKPDPTTAPTLQLFPITVGVAVADDIIGDMITAGGVAIGRLNGDDEFIFKKYGNLVGLIQQHIWQ